MVLAPLGPLVAAVVALGLAVLLTLLVLALINFLSSAPYIGGWIASKAVGLEQAISHALGQAFSGIDSFIGGCIHAAARVLDHLWNGYVATAHALLHTAEALARLSGAVGAVRAIAHRVTQLAHGIDRLQKELTRQFHGIEHRVKTLERDLARGIGHDLRIHIKALEKDLTKVENKVIPAIRSDVATAEGEITNLYDWAKGKASLLGVGTFAFAVAAILDTLGLGGIKCPSFGNMFNKRGCGMWNGLEDLLGLFADVLAFTHVCAIVEFLSPIVSDVATPVVTALSGVGAGICQGSIGAPDTLTVPQLYLPDTSSVTLNIP